MVYQPIHTEDVLSASKHGGWFISLYIRRMVYQLQHAEDGLTISSHGGRVTAPSQRVRFISLYPQSVIYQPRFISFFTRGMDINLFTWRMVYQPLHTEDGLSASIHCGWFISLYTQRIVYLVTRSTVYQPLHTEDGTSPLHTRDGLSSSSHEGWFISLFTRRMVCQPLPTEDDMSASVYKTLQMENVYQPLHTVDGLSASSHRGWFTSLFKQRMSYQPLQIGNGSAFSQV
jgi:hypothetical protein